MLVEWVLITSLAGSTKIEMHDLASCQKAANVIANVETGLIRVKVNQAYCLNTITGKVISAVYTDY